MSELDRFRHSNFEEVFGKLISVHKMNRTFGQIVLVPGALLFVVAIATIAFVETRDFLAIVIFVIPFLVLLIFVIRQIIKSRRDELKIYQEGFTYKCESKLFAARWSEIATLNLTLMRKSNDHNLNKDGKTVESVSKLNGEYFVFEEGLLGLEVLESKYQEYLSSKT